MPISDIVIDTNVFVHSDNPHIHFNNSAKETLQRVIDENIKICVDDIFDIRECENTSRIGSEYYRNLTPGTYGYTCLLQILIKQNIKQIIKKEFNREKRELGQLVSNRTDIVFVIVTIGSDCKTLVSNDYQDFNRNNRNIIKRRFDINIKDSDDFNSI